VSSDPGHLDEATQERLNLKLHKKDGRWKNRHDAFEGNGCGPWISGFESPRGVDGGTENRILNTLKQMSKAIIANGAISVVNATTGVAPPVILALIAYIAIWAKNASLDPPPAMT
jgi:hypothetical protein